MVWRVCTFAQDHTSCHCSTIPLERNLMCWLTCIFCGWRLLGPTGSETACMTASCFIAHVIMQKYLYNITIYILHFLFNLILNGYFVWLHSNVYCRPNNLKTLTSHVQLILWFVTSVIENKPPALSVDFCPCKYTKLSVFVWTLVDI